MRKTKLSSEEVAELDETKNKENRKGAFGLMSVRDRGWHRLDNGILMFWDGLGSNPRHVAPGEFGLKIDGKVVRFDAEEFRKFLRWV